VALHGIQGVDHRMQAVCNYASLVWLRLKTIRTRTTERTNQQREPHYYSTLWNADNLFTISLCTVSSLSDAFK